MTKARARKRKSPHVRRKSRGGGERAYRASSERLWSPLAKKESAFKLPTTPDSAAMPIRRDDLCGDVVVATVSFRTRLVNVIRDPAIFCGVTDVSLGFGG